MIYHRRADERGKADFSWLESYHSFSFGRYYDANFMGFENLRVINDDKIAGGGGFNTHPHQDMEIITFVTKGALEHKDTLGSHAIIRPGEIQIMSAGTGIYHSEHNHLSDSDTTLFQIWIEPNKKGVTPRYEQYDYMDRRVENGLTVLVTPEGGDKIASIHAQAKISLGHYIKKEKVSLELNSSKSYWLQMVDGTMNWKGSELNRGDGLAFKDEDLFEAESITDCEFLLFELA